MEGFVLKNPISRNSSIVNSINWKKVYLVLDTDGKFYEYNDKDKTTVQNFDLKLEATSSIHESPNESNKKFIFVIEFNEERAVKYSVDNLTTKNKWISVVRNLCTKKQKIDNPEKDDEITTSVPYKYNLLYRSKMTVKMLVSKGFISLFDSYKPVQLFMFPGRIAWLPTDNIATTDEYNLDAMQATAYEHSVSLTDGVEINQHFEIIKNARAGQQVLRNSATGEIITLIFTSKPLMYRTRGRRLAVQPAEVQDDFSKLDVAYLADKTTCYLPFCKQYSTFSQSLKSALAIEITSNNLLRIWYYSAVAYRDTMSMMTIMRSVFTQYCPKIRPRTAPDESDVPVFIRFLSMATEGKMIFVLFFCLKFAPDFMEQFAADLKLDLDRSKTAGRMNQLLTFVEKSIESPEWQANSRLIYSLFLHPASTHHETPVFDNEFKKWFNSYKQTKLTVTWPVFKQILLSPAFCAFSLVRHAVVNFKPEEIVKLVELIPDTILQAEFDDPTTEGAVPEATPVAVNEPSIWSTGVESAEVVPVDISIHVELPEGNNIGPHFIQLLFDKKLSTVTKELTRIFLSKGAVHDNVIRRFFSEAMVYDRMKVATDFAQEILVDITTGLVSDQVFQYPLAVATIWNALRNSLNSSGGAGAAQQQLAELDDTKHLVLLLVSFETIRFDQPHNSDVETVTQVMAKDTQSRHAYLSFLQSLNFMAYLSSEVHAALQSYVMVEPAPRPALAAPLTPEQQRAVNAVYGLVVTYYEADKAAPENKTVLREFFSSMGSHFFSTFLGLNQPLRLRLVKYIQEKFAVYPVFAEAMDQNEFLFSHPEHFDENILRCFSLALPFLSEFSVELTLLALAIEEFDELEMKLRAINDQCGKNKPRKVQLHLIVMAAAKKSPQEFINENVSLSDLVLCAQYAVDALEILAQLPTSGPSDAVKLMFSCYLATMSPVSWLPMFKSAHNMAFFVKYLDRENLDLCYTKFEEQNSKDPAILTLISKVKAHYKKPLVERSSDLSMGDSVELLTQRLFDSANSGRMSEEMSILTKISAHWLRHTNEIYKYAMAPRNAQMVLTMVMIEWFQRLKPTSNERALIAQVGTGEGKSLIIAMLSIYLVKVKGKKVHILENNVGLLRRDHASFVDFYLKFGIESQACVSGHREFDGDCDVCYCLGGAVDSYYRSQTFAGQKPFENTVLIVDEVDELVVDNRAYHTYVQQDADYSHLIKGYFDLLRDSNGNSVKPEDAPLFLWDKARSAYHEKERMKEGQDYVLTDVSGYCLVDSSSKRGRILTNRYSLTMEYVNYIKRAVTPRFNSSFFVQSMRYMMSQYHCIIGLSGSPGSAAEQKYLNETFGAQIMYTPSFLDTCTGGAKKQLKLIDSRVWVYENVSQQSDAAIEMASSLAQKVPVLLITTSPVEAQRLYDAYIGITKKSSSVQLFLQLVNGKPQDCNKVVDRATQRVEEDGGPFMVTITDYWGGRGHDYRVTDTQVNIKGGLAVIMTTFPDSERELIQWKGRSARGDNNGQYTFILSRADVPDSSLLAKHALDEPYAYHEGIISDLAKLSDQKIQSKMDENAADVLEGQRLNELCDAFYAKYPFNAQQFPANPQQRQLVDFLKSHKYDKESIINFSVAVGLISNKSEFKTKYE